jgi:serine/threonine-protein kinase RsbW
MSPTTTELTFPSRIAAVDEATTAVAEILQRTGITEDLLYDVEVALREAVANAVLHGNRQDPSKAVIVTVTIAPEALELTVHDEGAGFDPDAVPDPTAPDQVLRSSGRGLLLMRSFMDHVAWLIRAEGGTTVHMTKKR